MEKYLWGGEHMKEIQKRIWIEYGKKMSGKGRKVN